MRKFLTYIVLCIASVAFAQEKELNQLADKSCEKLTEETVKNDLQSFMSLLLKNDAPPSENFKKIPFLKVPKGSTTVTLYELYKKKYTKLSDDKLTEKIVKDFMKRIIFNCDEYTALTRKSLPKPEENSTLLKVKEEVDNILLNTKKKLSAKNKADLITEAIFACKPEDKDAMYQNNPSRLYGDLMNYFLYINDDFYKQHSWSVIEKNVLNPIFKSKK